MGYLHLPGGGATGYPAGAAARKAGRLLLLTAAASVVMVFARVMADADRDTLIESLHAIAANQAMYGLSGAARVVSGAALMGAAWFLLKAQTDRGVYEMPDVAILFITSGFFTAISGGCAVALAVVFAPSVAEAAFLAPVDFTTDTVDYVRWFSGKAGFALAGLALLIIALRQRASGGALRRVAPATALIGAGMQFIWIDAATVMHQVVGVAFFAWLVVVGALLATGRLERGGGAGRRLPY